MASLLDSGMVIVIFITGKVLLQIMSDALKIISDALKIISNALKIQNTILLAMLLKIMRGALKNH